MTALTFDPGPAGLLPRLDAENGGGGLLLPAPCRVTTLEQARSVVATPP